MLTRQGVIEHLHSVLAVPATRTVAVHGDTVAGRLAEQRRQPGEHLAEAGLQSIEEVLDRLGSVGRVLELEHRVAELEARHDDYAAIMLKVLADRLAGDEAGG